MKNPFLSTVFGFFIMATTGLTYAEGAPPPPPMHGPGMGMGMHHGMGGMMAGMSDEQKDKHLRGMQEHMLKMHDLSNRILAEKDSAKQELLKTEQIQLMKAHHAEMMEHHKNRHEPPK